VVATRASNPRIGIPTLFETLPPAARVTVTAFPAPATTPARPATEPAAALPKSRLVERIIELNPSASPEFLATFPEPALGAYLDHLSLAQEPRGRSAPWIRRGDSPAILSREARE
jgi:hypothetical protein